mmetsp:Transcript_30574/g.49468  ORF Transcript_30574/g.49468 Transcript_30574/m.49468 type:complete len:1140 (-) Transcript_30574:64-3483(-)|eukprot:CAMPEP_0184648596 /NCGR_PEP_ID=MMETSP0308-20130426/5745_1 /TAXON_ID=38269 /ORGANISM="Gloeochaete witrockiana, Strain SAG 46.84" /LENGTH=1139 /DNA_ID=CAMNT_0027080559 /DNA_START=143 /DNA_END=3562 /DNA_ORIENTATION=+
MFIRRTTDDGRQASVGGAEDLEEVEQTNLNKGVRRSFWARFFTRTDVQLWNNMGLIVFGLVGFSLYIYSTYQQEYGAHTVWEITIESIITFYFLLDLIVATSLANSKIMYLLSIDGIVSILSILPIIGVILSSTDNTVFLRAFRMFSVLRAIRALYRSPVILSKNAVIQIAITSVIAPVISASLIATAILYFIYTLSNASFITYGFLIPDVQWHDMWYASTLALLMGGFNDIAPNSAASRMVATFMVLAAIFVIPWQVAYLVSFLNNMPKYMGAYRPKARTPHVVVCGTSPPERFVSFVEDYFYRGRSYGDSELVFLVPGNPHTELLVIMQKPQFRGKITFLKGSPMSLQDLRRAKVSLCSAVFLLADQSAVDPTKEDALIMMRYSAVRSYDPSRPILVEVLLSGTKRHIPNAVCLGEINVRLMSRAAVCPGLGTLITDLLTSHVQKVHVSSKKSRMRRRVRTAMRNLKFWEVRDPLGDDLDHQGGMSTMVPLGNRRISLAGADDGWVEEYNHSRSNEVYSVRLGRSFAGMPYKDACLDLYIQKGVLLVGLEVSDARKGPCDVNCLLKETDVGYIIATSEDAARDVVNYARKIIRGGEVHSRPRHQEEYTNQASRSPGSDDDAPSSPPDARRGRGSQPNGSAAHEEFDPLEAMRQSSQAGIQIIMDETTGHGKARAHRLSLAQFPVNSSGSAPQVKVMIDTIMRSGSSANLAELAATPSASKGYAKGRMSPKDSITAAAAKAAAEAEQAKTEVNVKLDETAATMTSSTPVPSESSDKSMTPVPPVDNTTDEKSISAVLTMSSMPTSPKKVVTFEKKALSARSASLSPKSSIMLSAGIPTDAITAMDPKASEHVLVCCCTPLLGSRLMCDWLRFFAEGIRIQLGGYLSTRPIVILQPQAPWPLIQPASVDNVTFVEGSPLSREDLLRVNISKARVVIILTTREGAEAGSDTSATRFEAEAVDMDAITACQEIDLMTGATVMVELAFKSNVRFIKPPPPRSHLGIHFWPCVASGKAFPAGALDTLLCQAYYNGREVLELLKVLVGDKDDHFTSSVFHIRMPDSYHGKRYQDLFSDFLQDGRLLPIGLYRPAGTKGSHVPYVYTNPPPGTPLLPRDKVFVLRSRAPPAPGASLSPASRSLRH